MIENENSKPNIKNTWTILEMIKIILKVIMHTIFRLKKESLLMIILAAFDEPIEEDAKNEKILELKV